MLTLNDIETANKSIKEIAEQRGEMLWQTRRDLFAIPQPLDNDSREELCSLYPEETANQLARRYRTTISQVHMAWQGRTKSATVSQEMAIAMYLECDDLNTAARLLDISTATLIHILERAGVYVSKTERHRHDRLSIKARNKAIKYDLANRGPGVTKVAIAEKYGVHHSYLSHIDKDRPRRKRIDVEAVKEAIKKNPDTPVTHLAHMLKVSVPTIYKYKKVIANEATN